MILFAVSLFGCKENKEDTGKESKKTGYTSKEIFDKVSGAMKDMPDMTTVTDETEGAKDLFLIFSELDYDKVENYVFSYSTTGLADEIIVVHLKDDGDIKELEEDLQERLESRKSTFQVYNTEEGSKFQGADVLTQDNCAVLLIGNQAQNGKYVFEKLFK